MKTYRLVPGITSRQRIEVCTREKGVLRWKGATLDPGVEYEMPDDPDFEASLRAKVIERPYSQQVEEILKHNGIEYEVKMCKQCGGRVKKLRYRPVEVFE